MRLRARAGLGGWLLLVSVVALAPPSEAAVAEDAVAPAPEPEPGPVRWYAVGPRFTISPGVFLPANGSAGFLLGVEGGYGFDLGAVILTPVVSLQGNWSSDWTVYSGLGGARVTLPLGIFGPFLEGGLGYGHVGGPLGYSSGGLALRGGAGFIVFFGRSFALGVTVRYDAVIDTPFKGWTIAPIILLTF